MKKSAGAGTKCAPSSLPWKIFRADAAVKNGTAQSADGNDARHGGWAKA